jgi:hypothetical protein
LGDSVAELLARDMMPMDQPMPQISRSRQRPKMERLGPNGERYELDEFELVATTPDGRRTLFANWVNGDGGIIIEDVIDDDEARSSARTDSGATPSRAAAAKQSASR